MIPTNPFANQAMVGDEFDVHGEIATFPNELDPDLLYDVAEELAAVGSDQAAARLEIERQHMLAHEDYLPMFTHETLSGLVMLLLIARATRKVMGEDDRVELTAEIGEIIGDRIGRTLEASVEEKIELYSLTPVSDEELDVFAALEGDQDVIFDPEELEKSRKGIGRYAKS
jgi:hypothetical protein